MPPNTFPVLVPSQAAQRWLSCLFKGVARDRAKMVPQKQPLVGEVGDGCMLTRPFALYWSCLFPNNRSATQPPGQPHSVLATKC